MRYVTIQIRRRNHGLLQQLTYDKCFCWRLWQLVVVLPLFLWQFRTVSGFGARHVSLTHPPRMVMTRSCCCCCCCWGLVNKERSRFRTTTLVSAAADQEQDKGSSSAASWPSSTSSFRGDILLQPPPLTVLIPAYNEALRINTTLQRYTEYFNQAERWKGRFRILVVDDGSTDQTAQVVQTIASTFTLSASSSSFSNNTSNRNVIVQCSTLPYNQGKGAALAHGVMLCVKEEQQQQPSTRGSLILTADADGSANISDVEVLYDRMVQLICDYHHLTHNSSRSTGSSSDNSSSDASIL